MKISSHANVLRKKIMIQGCQILRFQWSFSTDVMAEKGLIKCYLKKKCFNLLAASMLHGTLLLSSLHLHLYIEHNKSTCPLTHDLFIQFKMGQGGTQWIYMSTHPWLLQMGNRVRTGAEHNKSACPLTHDFFRWTIESGLGWNTMNLHVHSPMTSSSRGKVKARHTGGFGFSQSPWIILNCSELSWV